MVTKRGKQASRKAAARKYGFLEVPYILKADTLRGMSYHTMATPDSIVSLAEEFRYKLLI
ncbi:MAG: hypothetical protein Q8K59_07640 [Nitrosomonas sp.]|nr:hypothetical protein [Nitrosomonas sp.]MDP1950950.1 hypothetical protein [Nitrosomonas sp.]